MLRQCLKIRTGNNYQFNLKDMSLKKYRIPSLRDKIEMQGDKQEDLPQSKKVKPQKKVGGIKKTKKR